MCVLFCNCSVSPSLTAGACPLVLKFAEDALLTKDLLLVDPFILLYAASVLHMAWNLKIRLSSWPVRLGIYIYIYVNFQHKAAETHRKDELGPPRLGTKHWKERSPLLGINSGETAWLLALLATLSSNDMSLERSAFDRLQFHQNCGGNCDRWGARCSG